MEQEISIIIPVYNAGNFIVRCLESIKNQTYTHYEVLLIDDCGTDNSVEIITKYLSEHPDFNAKLIHNPKNLGLSESRNNGMKLSSGKFILFADQDDAFFGENALKFLVEKIKITNADFIIGCTRFLQNEVEKENNYHKLKNRKEIYQNREILDGFFTGEWAVTAWNKLYSKDFLIKSKLNFLPKILHEDELWAFETAVAAKIIAFVNEPTYSYFSLSNPTSMTGNVKLQNILDLKIMLFQMMKISAEKSLPEKSQKTVPFLQNFAMNSILARLLHDEKIWKKVYSEISAEFRKYNFPNQKYFRKPASLAYPAYKSRYDSSYRFYKKYPDIFARLL